MATETRVTSDLIPPVFWFRWQFPCYRLDPAQRGEASRLTPNDGSTASAPPTVKGAKATKGTKATKGAKDRAEPAPGSASAMPWPDLPADYALMDPHAVTPGHEGWFQARAGWAPEGLRFRFRSNAASRPIGSNPDFFREYWTGNFRSQDPDDDDDGVDAVDDAVDDDGDRRKPRLVGDSVGLVRGHNPAIIPFHGFQLWIDTRDTRDIHRASKYCHQLQGLIARIEKAHVTYGLKVSQRIIPRAQDQPLMDLTAIQSQLVIGDGEDHWQVDLFLPAASLMGYDPEVNGRLGWCVQGMDPEKLPYWSSVGAKFPTGEDPSLWSVLELRPEFGPPRTHALGGLGSPAPGSQTKSKSRKGPSPRG